ncbi:unnamed protein product, partial [Onchocerca flexuosa]|uniref:Secreted protein n=1 Tax=Onchocerca flexuosa TaxID=387005 RepID=A0A183HKC8_9BILA
MIFCHICWDNIFAKRAPWILLRAIIGISQKQTLQLCGSRVTWSACFELMCAYEYSVVFILVYIHIYTYITHTTHLHYEANDMTSTVGGRMDLANSNGKIGRRGNQNATTEKQSSRKRNNAKRGGVKRRMASLAYHQQQYMLMRGAHPGGR